MELLTRRPSAVRPIVVILSAILMAGVMTLAAAREVAAVESFLVAELSGDQEVPGPGDPDGSGFADVSLDPDTGTICYFIVVDQIAAATAAHIHEGAAGVDGPVVVTLDPPDADGFVDGCTAADPTLIEAILADPGAFYVNVHNADFPGGAVRGQLQPPPVPLFAEMTGDQEVPGPGDPDGSGVAVLLLDAVAGEICYSLIVFDIAPATAAHLHEGATGVQGPVVVTFDAPDADGFAEGCVPVDPALVDAILADPAGYYVNVHNDEFPDGAIRGQLTDVPPAEECILLVFTESAPAPSDSATIAVGDPVIFLGVLLPENEGTLTLFRDSAAVDSFPIVTDAFGFFVEVLVFEPGEAGAYTVTASITGTDCAADVTLVVEGGPPTETPAPSPTPAPTPASPTPTPRPLPDTSALDGERPAPAPVLALTVLGALATLTVLSTGRRLWRRRVRP